MIDRGNPLRDTAEYLPLIAFFFPICFICAICGPLLTRAIAGRVAKGDQ